MGAVIWAGRDQQGYVRALREGLEALGWVDGKNIQVEYRWAGGDVDRLKSDAASLVALDAEVIVSGGTPATTALRQATERIPIVLSSMRRVGLIDITVGNATRLGPSQRSATRRCA